MNISCELTKDLLPLYYDGVCSGESRGLVEAHLAECAECRELFEKIQNTTLDGRMESIRDEVLRNHSQKIKRKLLIAGIWVAAIFTVPLIVCLIVNLATAHALDWFFIVLTALLTASSLTVVPLVVDKHRFSLTLGSFVLSLTTLLLTCCIYSGGDWFFVTIVPIIFGLSIPFSPILADRYLRRGFASRHKGLLVMLLDTALLFAVIAVCGVYGGGAGYWETAIPVTLYSLILPWALFVIIRYLKVNGLIRAGLCVMFCGCFTTVFNDVVTWILEGSFEVQILSADLFVWNEATINPNTHVIVLSTCAVVGITLLIVGICRAGRKRKKTSVFL